VMVTSMVVSGIESALQPVFNLGPWLDWATSLGINLSLNWLAFTLIYLVVPKPKIPFLDAVRGGLLAAILWEVGRQALTLYLLHLNYPNAYGIIGSFLAIMLWAYYAMLVLFYGAEYVRVIGEERASR
jgi:membrane protein